MDRTQNDFAVNPHPHGRGFKERVKKTGKVFAVRF